MASKMSERLNFKSVEELLGVVNEEAAMDIEIYKISGFKGHPFKVTDIVVEEQEFAESKAAAGNGGQNNYSRPSAAADAEGFMNIPDGIDDELPFS